MNGTTENVTHDSDEMVTLTPVWLKVLVVGLGVAIIGMLGLILYKIITGVGDMTEDTVAPVEVAAAQPTPVFTPGDYDIVRPGSMELVTVVPAGAEVFLHFRDKGGADQIIIFNRLTGETSTLKIAVPDS